MILLKFREIELVELYYYHTVIISATEYDQPRFAFQKLILLDAVSQSANDGDLRSLQTPR